MIHKLCFYFISKFDKSLINKLDKNIHIIYRNYEKKYKKEEILQIKKICKLQKRKFYLANNLKLAKKLNLDVIGLMCIPPNDENTEKYFSKMSEIKEKYKLNELSMGMSNDYMLALKYGSTYLRIGSKIFGSRS